MARLRPEPEPDACPASPAAVPRGCPPAVAALLLLLLLGLGACSNGPNDGQRLSVGEERQLFTQGYDGITDLYIEPTRPEILAMAGLQHLSVIDPSLSVKHEDRWVVLRHDDGVIDRLAAPEDGDSAGWATVTTAVIEKARLISPQMARDSDDRIDQAVFDGALTTLDRFSHYSRPDVARERRAAREGFSGVGVTLDPESSEVRITTVVPDGPAARAGLRGDDRILLIDGTPAETLPREEVVERLRGQPDTRVTLTVQRPGVRQPLTVSLTRVLIVVPTVAMRHDDHIAYIRVTSFNYQTADGLTDAIERARSELGPALRGIVLDLRGNPGGLLDQSVKVAGMFLDGGPVIDTKGRNDASVQSFVASPQPLAGNLPLAVIVNGGSASASEIVAAALQDTGRAVVIGSSSYGKGTVQTVLHLSNDGELTITWAKLITPTGYILHEHGVIPTICTDELGDDDAALTTALQRGTAATRDSGGTASAARALASQPRATLDERGWQRLRQLCPAQRVEHDVDLKLASRLLNDPVLYARALAELPTSVARASANAGHPGSQSVAR